MDENTKKFALKKAEALKSYIAYPDEFLDDKKLEEYYKGLEITPTNYLDVAANVSIYQQEYSFRQLRKPVKNLDWYNSTDVAVIDAAYHIEENSMGESISFAELLKFSKFKNYFKFSNQDLR